MGSAALGQQVLDDLLIGAPYDDDAATDAGAAYLFLGGGL
mgnify:CR=1 FL=1